MRLLFCISFKIIYHFHYITTIITLHQRRVRMNKIDIKLLLQACFQREARVVCLN